MDSVHLLETGGEGNSSNIQLRWKSWQGDSFEGLRWELWHILPTVGIEYVDARSASEKLRKLIPAWEGTWHLLGFEVGDCYGKSKHSERCQRPVQVDRVAEAEQEAWISSRGLLGLLLHSCIHRHSNEHKQLAMAVLRIFLASTTSVDVVREICGEPLTPDMLAKCSTARRMPDEPCDCVKQVEVLPSSRVSCAALLSDDKILEYISTYTCEDIISDNS